MFIQSFDATCLRALARRTPIPLVQLIEQDGDVGPVRLREISTYAQVLGAHKSLLVRWQGPGRQPTPTGLVERAHEAGLAVHAWTFRSENAFLPPSFATVPAAGYGDAAGEYAMFRELGIDGVFTDQPDIAVAALVQPAVR